MLKTRWMVGLGAVLMSVSGGIVSAQPAMDSKPAMEQKSEKGSIDAEAKKVLDRAIKETFGDQMNITSMRTEASMEMVGQGMRMDMLMQMSDGKMLTTVTIPGLGEMRSGYNGTVGWSFSELTGPALLEGAELDQTRRQMDMYSDVNWDKYYSSVSYAGEEKAQNVEDEMVDTHVLVFTPKNGTPAERRFYSQETGLLVRMEGSIAAQGNAMVPMVTRIGDYRDVDGMKMPFLTLAQMGPQQIRNETKSAKIGVEIPASTFALPEEIAEMVE